MPDAPQAEEALLTAAVNRTILEGFSALYEQHHGGVRHYAGDRPGL